MDYILPSALVVVGEQCLRRSVSEQHLIFGKYKLMFYARIRAWVRPYSCGKQLLGVSWGDEPLKFLRTERL